MWLGRSLRLGLWLCLDSVLSQLVIGYLKLALEDVLLSLQELLTVSQQLALCHLMLELASKEVLLSLQELAMVSRQLELTTF